MKIGASLVRSAGLIGLLLPLIISNAHADSNSVFLINVTNDVSSAIDQFTGTGIGIGQIELGVPDTNNLFLANRVILTTNLFAGTSGGIRSHATEVAGVMIATGTVVQGVAPGATVSSVAVTNSGGANPILDFATNAMIAAWFLATQQNVRVINASIALGGTEGATIGTSVWERAIDRLVSQTGVIYVQGAGNSGLNGPNTILQPGGAFNSIVVGAVNNANAGSQTNVPLYSAQGYLSDGRSKPDILAPGGSSAVSPTSTIPDGNLVMPTTNNPAAGSGPHYTTETNAAGTSYAAPAVAAVIARLLQAGAGGFPNTNGAASQDPRVIKAALLNEATKLPGWTQGTTVDGTVTNVVQPLDPRQGAGLMNANNTLLQLQAGRFAPTVAGSGVAANPVPLKGWDLFGVSLSLTNLYRLNTQAGGQVRLTVDWYRDVGPTVDGTNNTYGLANLDLYLWRSMNGGSFASGDFLTVANSVSVSDNVEQLYFTNLPAGYYQFGVCYTNYLAANDVTPLSATYGVAWDFNAVPEPSTLLLAEFGMATLWWRLKRRRT